MKLYALRGFQNGLPTTHQSSISKTASSTVDRILSADPTMAAALAALKQAPTKYSASSSVVGIPHSHWTPLDQHHPSIDLPQPSTTAALMQNPCTTSTSWTQGVTGRGLDNAGPPLIWWLLHVSRPASKMPTTTVHQSCTDRPQAGSPSFVLVQVAHPAWLSPSPSATLACRQSSR